MSRNIAIIPARSGSKGLKDKNIKLLNEKPLLAYSIEAAREACLFDEIHVSTDSQRYANIAVTCGASVPFLRTGEFSGDDATTWDTVRFVLKEYQKLGKTFDTVAVLQPTSPFRTKTDIQQAYQMMETLGARSIVAVCEAEHSPLWCNTLPQNRCLYQFITEQAIALPRQSLKRYYRVNGALYLIKCEVLADDDIYNKDSYAYIMPKERSIDIDDLIDFQFAQYCLQAYQARGAGANLVEVKQPNARKHSFDNWKKCG